MKIEHSVNGKKEELENLPKNLFRIYIYSAPPKFSNITIT